MRRGPIDHPEHSTGKQRHEAHERYRKLCRAARVLCRLRPRHDRRREEKSRFPPHVQTREAGNFSRQTGPQDGGESISYALKGVANEPLAQDHVVIDADARGRTRHRFTVPNVFGAEREAAYEVSSDLNFVGGDPQCVVRPNATSTYDMGVAPTCSGVFHGSITFTAPDGSFCWWTLEVRVAPPPVEDTLDLTVPVREALTTQITLANPSDQPATFRIYREGHGVLGADTMRIAARSETTYDLVYSPMLTGPTEGGVRFLSAQLGEFWYALRLDALDATAAVVPEMVSEVGGRARVHRAGHREPLGRGDSCRAVVPG